MSISDCTSCIISNHFSGLGGSFTFNFDGSIFTLTDPSTGNKIIEWGLLTPGLPNIILGFSASAFSVFTAFPTFMSELPGYLADPFEFISSFLASLIDIGLDSVLGAISLGVSIAATVVDIGAVVGITGLAISIPAISGLLQAPDGFDFTYIIAMIVIPVCIPFMIIKFIIDNLLEYNDDTKLWEIKGVQLPSVEVVAGFITALFSAFWPSYAGEEIALTSFATSISGCIFTMMEDMIS